MKYDIATIEKYKYINKTNSFGQRGFDVISGKFFVYEENGFFHKIHYFENFEKYFAFLNGDIYNNSCYYQYVFSEKQIKDYKLKIRKLKNTHFTSKNIDDWTFDFNDKNKYQEGEKNKKKLIKWIDKLTACKNGDDFLHVMNGFERSENDLSEYKDLLIDMFMKLRKKDAFKMLLNFCNHNDTYYAQNLALHSDMKRVAELYKPVGVSQQTAYKRRKDLKEFIDRIESGMYKKFYSKGFDEQSHFFYVETQYFFDEYTGIYDERHYFNTFDEFSSFLNSDLSDCDLSNAKLNIDFSKYTLNSKTILPLKKRRIKSIVTKKYDDNFIVCKKWIDVNGNVLNEKEDEFEFFFDFVYFLNNDISGTDFLLCDGIINLTDISKLNINDCIFKSDFLEKFGLDYDFAIFPVLKDFEFDVSRKNELETERLLQHMHQFEISDNERNEFNRIAYVSDIHLLHRFANCKTENDREAVVRKIAKVLASSDSDFLLIGGDVSSDFKYYKSLINEINISKQSNRNKAIFILGNHELWSFPNKTYEEIIRSYKDEINKRECYFLQNSIIYKQFDGRINQVSEEQLNTLSIQQLRENLINAQLIIFGGLAFSGLNEEFNANNGVYRKTINREQEINESKKFEKLYNKVCNALYDKNVIILTHTPKDDWTKKDYMTNFVYVNGHTHKNYFYDDGFKRIYADNQIGYKKNGIFLKEFNIGKEYDYFSDYQDGIYEINKNQYRNFCLAKNIKINYNRNDVIFMLKRDGYYCFFRKGKQKLSLLNGGSLTNVPQDINYYYDNMLDQIAFIKKPLDEYFEVQKSVSEQVKLIGGSGIIHGAIVDIDFYNHIYVNPYDLVITGYHASNIIDKQAYKNIPSLLKATCPRLYENYQKLLSNKTENSLVISSDTIIDTTPINYYETDIYKASREIKKMQKVNKGILCAWYDINTGVNLLE